MTSSNGNILRVTDPLCGEFTGRRWIPLTKVSDAVLWCFSLICAWTNDRVHNEYAGDLKRHRVHYDVTVMVQDCSISGALAMEILQSCTKPSICVFKIVRVHYQTCYVSAEIQMPCWQNIRHLLHWKLLFGQPVEKMWSIWHFRFGEVQKTLWVSRLHS